MVGAVAAIPVRVLVAEVVVVGTASGADVCATTDTRSAPKTYAKRGSVDTAIADGIRSPTFERCQRGLYTARVVREAVPLTS